MMLVKNADYDPAHFATTFSHFFTHSSQFKFSPHYLVLRSPQFVFWF